MPITKQPYPQDGRDHSNENIISTWSDEHGTWQFRDKDGTGTEADTAMDSMLDTLGSRGWELVAAEGDYLYFKRAKNENPGGGLSPRMGMLTVSGNPQEKPCLRPFLPGAVRVLKHSVVPGRIQPLDERVAHGVLNLHRKLCWLGSARPREISPPTNGRASWRFGIWRGRSSAIPSWGT